MDKMKGYFWQVRRGGFSLLLITMVFILNRDVSTYARNNLGFIDIMHDNYSASRNNFIIALGQGKLMKSSLRGLGIAYIRENKIGEGLIYFLRSCQSPLEDELSCFFYMASSSRNDEIDVPLNVLVSNNDGSRLLLIGHKMKSLGRPDIAIDLYHSALKLSPVDWHAAYYLGAALDRAGEIRESYLYLKQAYELSPTDSKVLYRLALVSKELENYDEALALFNTYIEDWPDDYEGWYGRGLVLESKRKYSEAIDAFTQALLRKPGDMTISNALERISESEWEDIKDE